MKLFQQLLVAPAALGLLAPVAASAADLNLNGVNQYASSTQDQVTSVTQFSDVRPTDWAYQALSNLVSRYGCVAGYPKGTFQGGQSLTRYEAAALLNACLDRVSETTDELKRLISEFSKEISVIRGRVDRLEAKVGELEATQFSTTTKLKGSAYFTLGANSYSGTAALATNAKTTQGATAFNYDLRLDLDTSFTGKDLLRTRLRSGNFGGSPWGGPTVGLNSFEIGFPGAAAQNNLVQINRLFYQFPVGSNFTATVGPRVRQDDMMAVWPSDYPADTIIDFFTYAGAPGTYSLNLGAGAGLWWKQGKWSISGNYVSANGNSGNPVTGGGIATDSSDSTGTLQVAYSASNYGLAVGYTSTQTRGNANAGLYAGNGTPFAVQGFGAADSVNSLSLSGFWRPSKTGLIPSISVGWGLNSYRGTAVDGGRSQSWYVGMQWPDAFVKGNTFGMAVGQPTFVTKAQTGGGTPDDGNYAMEWWYKFQVTDNISVTPALFYLSAPLGQQIRPGNTLSNVGGVIKTTFKF